PGYNPRRRPGARRRSRRQRSRCRCGRRNTSASSPSSSSPPLPPPIFLRLALHCWRGRVLELEPVGRWARTVARAEPLRHDALEAELAGVAKDHVARLGDVLVELQADLSSPTQQLA